MITAHEVLSDCERFVYRAVLAEHGEKIAIACAHALFECLFLNFRKQYLYVPTRKPDQLNARYEAIWHEFNGHNHDDLAIKYGISKMQIYTITGRMRKRFVGKHQADLFPVPVDTPSKPLALTVLEEYLPADLVRAGLSLACAADLAKQVVEYLCKTYPGISVRVTESLLKKRPSPNQPDLFA